MICGSSLLKALSLFRKGYEMREMKLNKLSTQKLALETAFQERKKNLTGSAVGKHQMRTKPDGHQWVWSASLVAFHLMEVWLHYFLDTDAQDGLCPAGPNAVT